MTSTSMHPRARTKDLITTEIDDDLQLFDVSTHHLHQLDRAAAGVWRMADGTLSLPDLAAANGLTITAAEVILGGLSAAGLLITPWSTAESSRLTRRRFLRGAGVAAGIVSVSAPLAAQARLSDCAPGDDCTPQDWGQQGTGLAAGSMSGSAPLATKAQSTTCLAPEDCTARRWGSFCCPGGSQTICAKDLSDDSFTCIPSDMCTDPDWNQVECFPLTG